FLGALERLCFARAMGVVRDNHQNARFAKVTAARGRPTALYVEGVLELTAHERKMLIKKISDPCNQDRRRILALRANAALPGGEVILDSITEATVEHILPLSDTPEWIAKFSRKDARNDMRDLLGNFAIVTAKQNHEADKQNYADKLKIYFDT